MATDTTDKTETTEAAETTGAAETAATEAAEQEAVATETKGESKGETATQAKIADVVADFDDDGAASADDAAAAEAAEAAPAARRQGPFGGALAVVAAALGAVSLTGGSIADQARDRKQLIGQVASSAQGQTGGASPSDQINSLYTAPWHATALFNSVFALLAVVVGGLVLIVLGNRAETKGWVKAVSLGGVILGVIGLAVAAGMYLNLFGGVPQVPGSPS